MKTHKTIYLEIWKIVFFFSVMLLLVPSKCFSTDRDAIGFIHQRSDVTRSLPRMSSGFMGTVDYELIPGDANCDGVVNVLDVISSANYFVGNEPDPFCFENADVNGDGAINILDIILTIEIFLGDLNTYNLHLEASPDDAGTVTGAGEYLEGEHVSIAAEAAPCWDFANWTGDTDFIDDDEAASTMITMPAQDIHLTANFTAVEPEPPLLTVMVYCDLSYNPIEGALVEFWSYNYLYSGITDENGQVVFLNIPPGQCGGYIYKEEYHWYDLDFEMEDHDKHIAARLHPLPFGLLLSAHPAEGGNVEGSGIYSYGQEVIISATDAANWEFVHWSGDTQYLHDDVSVAVNTITMPGTDIVLEALFYSTVFPTVDLIIINNTQPGVTFAEAVVVQDPGDDEAIRGFVWGTEEYPDLEHNEGFSVDQGAGPGTFSKDITDLTPNTNYFIRAYATNNGGTAYSEQFDFNFWDYHGTITDIDGNVYNTIVIGNQEWMAENLKTTRYRNSAAIAHPANNTEWENNTSGAYAWFEYDSSWKDSYGALYNWHAVNNTNGLCPAGWHVPGDAEWTQLSDHIGGGGIGKKLKSCLQLDSPWGDNCDTGEHPRWDAHNTQYGVNEYGFSALPGGHRWPYGPFGHLGSRGRWWSSTEKYATSAWYRWMIYESGAFFPSSNNKNYGYSVRCVRNVSAH